MITDQQRRSISVKVSRILRAERERRGLSLTAVAEKAGLSQQMVSYVERGMRNPTLDTLLRITGALNAKLHRVIQDSTK